MARRPGRRRTRRRKIPEIKPSAEQTGEGQSKPGKQAPAPRPKKKARDPGHETSADTRLVNALESDPEFFKDPLIGRTVGKCKVEKLLGEGRTAVVYRAHYAPLKRTVALKVLLPAMLEYPAVVRVFQQEGRAVAALDHENVLKIYDVGRDGDHYYLVLELLRGRSLLNLIEEAGGQGLDVAEALDYVRQAAAGLAAAHRKKLVHRDIKPQNLVIEPGGKLKIVDFGLAAEAEGAFSGGRLGTPHYMSPEQCKGEQAGTSSDIYSLGITLFHMLVGHAPYAGRTTTDEIIGEHLKGERLEPEKLRPDLPRPVAELVRRMTRRDPASRPSAAEICKLVETRLTPERLDRTRRRAPGRARRGRARSDSSSSQGTLIVIGGLIVLGLVVALFLMQGGGGDRKTTGAQPATPEPEPVAEQPPEPKPEPEPKRAPEIASEREQAYRQLLNDAKREERTGNVREALVLYQRVVAMAPPESRYFKEADAAAKTLRDRLEVDAGVKERPVRQYITIKESEEAGKEFFEKVSELRRRLTLFELDGVEAELKGLVARTREESAERKAVEAELERTAMVRDLISVVEGRASGLRGDKAQWINYDEKADPALIVVGVGPKGVELMDEETESTQTRAWAAIEPSVRVDLLEKCRSPRSASETTWLGYYCRLIGDERSERYFDYALMMDDSPELRARIKALRELE